LHIYSATYREAYDLALSVLNSQRIELNRLVNEVVIKPCAGDPVANPEIVSSGSSGKKGGTFGCTRTANTSCGGVYGKKNHDGLDIKAGVNKSVFAMYSGTISSIRNTFSPGEYKKDSYGNFVVITTIINGVTRNIKYNHLNNVSVTQGPINVGDIIGLTGNTGNANPPVGTVIPHIHLQVFNSNWSQSLDPEDYLKTKFDSNYNPVSNNCQ
jgi:murein DD-endopeptidase MepM/ murein hydrolase activator NlpD